MLTSDRPLIAYLDFKSPYAYLAWEPTVHMARELGIAVDWRPFVLDIPSFLGSARLDRSGRVAEANRSAEQWSGVKYSYFDCRRYANLRGLTVRGTVKIWDTSLAAIGMLWAKRQGDAMLERYVAAVYEPFWKRELDVEDVAEIRRILESVGADVAGFEAYARGPGAEENAILQHEAFDAGVFGVPTYVVNGELYFGREHLPRVRWHLSGEQGPPPDVAYAVPEGAHVAPAERLEVCIDFASAQSYLALAGTLQLVAELGLRPAWRPLITPPQKAPPPPRPDDDRGTRHRRFRARYTTHDIQRYAAHGLPNVHERTDGRVAALGLLWVEKAAPQRTGDYVEAVFARLWRRSAPIGQVAAVEGVIRDLGMDATGFADYRAGAGPEELDALQVELKGQGVISAPTYLLDGEPFVGRQHLPLIEARLRAGRG